MLDVYKHVNTLHEDPPDDMEDVGLTYFCRVCPSQPFSMLELKYHTRIHGHKSGVEGLEQYSGKSMEQRSGPREKSNENIFGYEEKNQVYNNRCNSK